jgi:hypothetical protein
MKKWVIAVFIIVLLLLLSVFYWLKINSYSSLIATAKFKEVKTVKYTIETPGIDPRVYEWNTSNNYHCIALFRDNSSTAPAMQCYKIERSK